MKVQWFRSATVGVISNSGSSVLCDPWITDGAFIGSWFHFPPLEGFEFDKLLSQKWDAVYISHLHADHFDRKFLAALSRAQPECIAVIPSFSHDWLRRAVENCGFSGSRLKTVESGESLMVGDISATVYVADHCDPSICGVTLPCHSRDPRLAALDSIGIFEADGQKIVNANDALAVASSANVLPGLGKVDLLLGHYGGAGPFPQTFVDLTPEEKKRKAKILAEGFLSRLAGAANTLRASYVMPFAGHYVLGGRLSNLNPFRSVVPLSAALEWIKNHSRSIPVAVSPFGFFDLDSGQVSDPWVEPTESATADYIARISHNVFPYEKSKAKWEGAEEDLGEALRAVGAEYERRIGLGQSPTDYRISIDTDRVSGWVDFAGEDTSVHVGNLEGLTEQETRLRCHPNLLKGLVTRAPGFTGFTPMHFNQAEIGSHFEWRRRGDFNEVVRCLNFLQVTSRKNLHLLPA